MCVGDENTMQCAANARIRQILPDFTEMLVLPIGGCTNNTKALQGILHPTVHVALSGGLEQRHIRTLALTIWLGESRPLYNNKPYSK